MDDGGRRLLGSGFPGDLGAADPALERALADYHRAPGADAHARVVAALASARLLVPVVAVLGESEVDAAGLVSDKSSEMAAVLLTGRDGRRALLAFSGMTPLRAWRADARPVPVTARDAARSALQEGADALVVDVAGPALLVVERADLEGLARDWQVAWMDGSAVWLAPDDSESGNES
ncbi:SseB family protein [Nocardioides acrostichi]|uniref:SseB family protein n=1 Tax=Nocardioides acrostichi TaxID=2784339 RepID=A0A930Y8H0_9ACTN|nr:SseB family protein [Nocardioides acrostichi]MBF4163056.1 SseB family protein [Nocardioides acrostichi]